VGAPPGIHHSDLRIAALRDGVSEVMDEIEDREGLVMICPHDGSGRGARIASRLSQYDWPVVARIPALWTRRRPAASRCRPTLRQ
jgi:hypothetical protein